MGKTNSGAPAPPTQQLAICSGKLTFPNKEHLPMPVVAFIHWSTATSSVLHVFIGLQRETHFSNINAQPLSICSLGCSDKQTELHLFIGLQHDAHFSQLSSAFAHWPASRSQLFCSCLLVCSEEPNVPPPHFPPALR